MNVGSDAKSSKQSGLAVALSEGTEVHVIRPHNGSKPRLLDRAALQTVCGWIFPFSLRNYLMAQLLFLHIHPCGFRKHAS